MDFFPPGKSKHIFWLKNSQRREVGPDHWWPESSLSPRNGVEARNLATQPRRYFCIFATMTQGCTSLDLPSQNLPSLHFRPLHCRRTAAGQQQEESGGQGLTSQDSRSPPSLSAASLSVKGRSSWTLSPGVLPSYSALSLQEWSPLVPLGCRPWRRGVQTLSVKNSFFLIFLLSDSTVLTLRGSSLFHIPLKQSRTLCSFLPPPPTSSACLLSVEKL